MHMGDIMSEQKRQAAVYRQLSADMRQGLKDIYQQISTASAAEGAPPATDALFHEASAQLDEVLKDTEAAAMSIMEIVEKHLELQAESARILEDAAAGGGDMARLAAINGVLGEDHHPAHHPELSGHHGAAHQEGGGRAQCH